MAATDFETAVSQAIVSSNQLHDVVNGTALETVDTDSGEIPSVRKALTDSMMFIAPIPWEDGADETNLFQTRSFESGTYWAPAATTVNPVPMGSTPIGDNNWFLAPVSLTDEHIIATTSPVFSNPNLLSNHNFLVPSPDDITHPSSTPTNYVAGTQIFSGIFVESDVTDLTYINGRVKWTNPTGAIYYSVLNTNGLEYITEFTASVADFDGKPRTRGVSFALVGDEYHVTVGIDALSDGVDDTPLGSVKFEQGKVATGHEVISNITESNFSNYSKFNFDSVRIMQLYPSLKVGDRVETEFYNRKVKCKWIVVASEENSYGNYSIPLANNLHAKLDVDMIITPAMTGAPAAPGDSTAASIKAAEFFDKEFVLDGIYGISGSEAITFREGQRVTSINGPVAGGAIKAAFIALSPMDLMVDLSSAKYADIHKVILDGASTGQRGFKGTNVFGLSMSQCRTVNLTVAGYEFINDGTGTGSFINSLTKCYASLSPAGFVVSSAASESNLFVFNECVATDCENYGFREFGDNTGRDNAYNDCDAEKCGIGFLMRSKNFNLVNPYIEFCDKGIVVDATGLSSGVQSGKISSPSILGKYNFPDPNIPTEDTIGIELIGFCRNITIDNPLVVYHKDGIVAQSPVSGLTISEPFLENNNQDYDIRTTRYKIRKGNQESSVLSSNTTNNITIGDGDDTIFVDLFNNTLTWEIDITNWLIGRSMEIVVMGDAVNTGTLTISGANGETLYGQNAGSRVGGSPSVVFDNGRLIKFIKQNDNTIYFVATQA